MFIVRQFSEEVKPSSRKINSFSLSHRLVFPVGTNAAKINTMSDQREFQLDFVFQTAAEGILITQADGFLARLNPAAAAMLELTPGEALGEPAAVLFKAYPALVQLCNAQGPLQIDVTLPHKRLATGVGADQPDGGRIVLLHDVTERASVESRREALIRQIAHDFRNPLNAVDGYADLVSKFGSLTSEQSKMLQRVRQTSQKAYELAETLVDLAWVDAGMAFEHKPFGLASLIREAIEELEPEARMRDITLVFSLQDPVPAVMGDPRRIQQVIVHLLENGMRYSYPDSNVAIHAWQEGTKVFCSVGDQGIGIRESDQENIWDRMWRSSDERVRAVPGGGIGLTFARAIIRRHGGQMWVESELDEGTTVTFVLPLAEGW
jgi:signal transduction histidine kinase